MQHVGASSGPILRAIQRAVPENVAVQILWHFTWEHAILFGSMHKKYFQGVCKQFVGFW